MKFVNMFKNTFKPIDKLSNNNYIKDIKMLVNRSLGLDMSSMHDESRDFSEIPSEFSNESETILMTEKVVFTICCSPISRYETDLENLMQSSCDKISTSINTMSSREKNAIKGTNPLWNCGSREHKIESLESLENKDNAEYFRNLQSDLPDYNKHSQQKDIDDFLVFSKDKYNNSTDNMLQNKFDVTTGTNEITSISCTNDNNLNTFMTQNVICFNLKHTQNSSEDVNVSEFMKNNSDVVTEITDNSPAEKNSNNSFLSMSGKVKNICSSKVFSEEKGKTLENVTFPVKSKENNRNVKHVCPHCSKCFRFPSKLKTHIRSHNLSDNLSECDERNELSGTVSVTDKINNWGSDVATNSSKIEIRKAKSVHKCPFCSSIFKVFSKLARHIKTHTSSKPYECQFCSKTFLERFNLLAHINIHKKEKNYVCDICQRNFNFKSNLTRHLRSHKKKKPFICSECGDAYCSENMLAIHVRKHEEKPYKCTECLKAFKKRANLKRHSEIHSNEKSYPCDLCDYVAKRNSHLKRHKARNHTK